MSALARWPAALWILLLVCLWALLGPWLSHWAPQTLDWSHLAAPPQVGQGHWFGTDRLGRDLYVRTLTGTRVSLGIALVAGVLSVAFGTAYGVLAGFCGGRMDAWMMRLVDVVYALPYVFFVILLTVVAGRSAVMLFIAMAAIGWLTVAQIVRAETRRLCQQPFIEAARVLGLPAHTLLGRHVLPNVIAPVLVYATLLIPQLILLESFLSFLGLGIQEPAASLGNLLSQGAQEMEYAPWMLLIPSAMLVTIVLVLTALGEWCRTRWSLYGE